MSCCFCSHVHCCWISLINIKKQQPPPTSGGGSNFRDKHGSWNNVNETETVHTVREAVRMFAMKLVTWPDWETQDNLTHLLQWCFKLHPLHTWWMMHGCLLLANVAFLKQTHPKRSNYVTASQLCGGNKCAFDTFLLFLLPTFTQTHTTTGSHCFPVNVTATRCQDTFSQRINSNKKPGTSAPPNQGKLSANCLC